MSTSTHQSLRGRLDSSKWERLPHTIRRQIGRLSPGSRELPSYLIVGTKRGGTSSLHEYICAHPDVLRSHAVKGSRFFDVNYHRGWQWFTSYQPSTRKVERLAKTTGRRPIIGDASPYYIFHPDAPARIAKHLPDARLIFLVREPVARAWSHYNYEKSRGNETLDFADALEAEPGRLAGPDAEFAHRHHTYDRRGRYIDQIEAMTSAIPADQLLVIESEKLFFQPDETMQTVFSHLGVAPFHGDFTAITKANEYKGLDPDLHTKLAQHYNSYNERLEAWLGRPLSWDSTGTKS